jgi:hypothetical protein
MTYRLLLLIAVLGFDGCAALTATSGRVAIQDEKSTATTEVNFSEHDRLAIQRYFKANASILARGSSLPAGFGRYDVLPGTLVGESLPTALEHQLAPVPNGYRRLRVGHDVVLMRATTRTVSDIIFRPGS